MKYLIIAAVLSTMFAVPAEAARWRGNVRLAGAPAGHLTLALLGYSIYGIPAGYYSTSGTHLLR